MEKKELQFSLDISGVKADGSFAGYASVFDVTDSHNDVVVRGAFERTLSERADVKLLWQHRMDEPIGVINELREDQKGLYIEGTLLLDVARAGEAYALLKSGAIDGLSIGYSVTDYDYEGETGVRLLKDVDLWEVSLVTFPANEHASITALKASGLPQTVREFEGFLRDAGYSKNESKHIATSGFALREAEEGMFDRLEQSLDRAMGSITI
jgi:HK97 family phage prohead protease